MNRGSGGGNRRVRPTIHASMRPRFMNRGSALLADEVAKVFHGFNEAPIHESGKSSSEAAVALDARVASMRPRFMNRGSGSGVLLDVVGFGLQ